MTGKDSFSRRSMLKTVGYGGAGVVAASGTASAESDQGSDSEDSPPEPLSDSESKEYLSDYQSQDDIEEAVETYAKETIEQLAQEGHLDAATTDELPLDAGLSDREQFYVNDDAEGVGVDAFEIDSEKTALITISANTEQTNLSIYIQPDREKGYAVAEGPDGIQLYTGDSCDGWTKKETACQFCSCSYCRPKGWVKMCCCTRGAPGCCYEDYKTCYFYKTCCYCCD
jgi:hypothetical protein